MKKFFPENLLGEIRYIRSGTLSNKMISVHEMALFNWSMMLPRVVSLQALLCALRFHCSLCWGFTVVCVGVSLLWQMLRVTTHPSSLKFCCR